VSISPRPHLRVGWEVRPSVSISQNEDRRQVVDLIRQYFGCGSIRPDRSDLTVKWEVRSLRLLLESVLPHFEVWPLLSAKQHDVRLLGMVCRMMTQRAHHTPAGLLEIARLVEEMNPSGVRRYTASDVAASVSR
jgi:hypothetical protein